MPKPTLPITAHFNGRAHSREDVLGWEFRRAVKVARRLRIASPHEDLETLGRQVLERKLEIGHDEIRRLLKRDLRLSNRGSQFGAAVSRGRRKVASVTLTCETGNAELIPEWYREHFTANDEISMLAATPDHWLFEHRPGAEEVLETPAGSPVVVQMFFDDSDVSTVRTPHDPEFPVEWVAIARNAKQTPIGGIRHQFRDESDGFHVRLNVEFPITTLAFQIRAHCWHLASEFSNWIEFANGIRDPEAG